MAATVLQAATLSIPSAGPTPVLNYINSSNYTYQCVLNLTNMESDDVVVATIKRQVIQADPTTPIMYQKTFSGVQDAPVAVSLAVPAPFGIVFTIERTAGAGTLSLPYSVEAIS